jgi:hypothetical protein
VFAVTEPTISASTDKTLLIYFLDLDKYTFSVFQGMKYDSSTDQEEVIFNGTFLYKFSGWNSR